MRHYRPFHEPICWPFWHDLAICAVALAFIFTGAHVFAGASTEQTADRLEARQVTDTVPPPPTPRQQVNAMPYRLYNDKPAMEAFRIVAVWRGWSATKVVAWTPFVRDVMIGESGFCWNRRRGDSVAYPDDGPVGCKIVREGRYEDVGFGQATTSLYGSKGVLCLNHGVCHSSQILASPWDSMLYSIVIPIEEHGSQPWCYNSAARSYHDCWLAPDR